MANKHFRHQHLHYQVLYQFALLEQELEALGQEVPRLPLKDPATLLESIKALRANLHHKQAPALFV